MMRKQIYRLGLLSLLCLWQFSGMWAQEKKGDRYFEQMQYAKAAKYYEKALQKDPGSTLYWKAGWAYEQANDPYNAARLFIDALNGTSGEAKMYLAAGRNLKDYGQYAKAKKYFLRYAEATKDPLGYQYARSCDQAKVLMEDTETWRLSLAPEVNSKWSEICPVWYRGGLILASNRPRGFFSRFVNGAKGLPFYDLYYSQRAANGLPREPLYLNNGINHRFHDGPISFTSAEDEACITRSGLQKGRAQRDEKGVNKLGLYFSRQIEQKWQKGEAFEWNDPSWNVAHAALTSDGQTLYFVSDRPAGQGGSDIYRSKKDEQGKWSEPENLGAEVNSAQNELFLTLREDSILYFASDRPEGLGGLDIFSVTLRGNQWSEVRNEGFPLNSNHDDFGITFIPGTDRGYFTSNRPGGPGEDNIWQFRRLPSYRGLVVDARTGEPLPNCEVILTDADLKEHRYTTDLQGRFRHVVKSGKLFRIRVQKENYVGQQKDINLAKVPGYGDLSETWKLSEDKILEVSGRIYAAENQAGIPGAEIRMITDTDEFIVKAGAGGNYQHELGLGQNYTMIFTAPGFAPFIQEIRTLDEMEPITFRVDAELASKPYALIEGSVNDQESGKALGDAKVRVLATGTQIKLGEGSSREDGRFWIPVDTAAAYSIIASQQGYFTSRRDLDTLEQNTALYYEKLELAPLGPDQVFKVVHHAYNVAGVNAIGKRDLNEITYFLEDNPGVKVLIESHTDARGSKKYNEELSQERAEAVRSYLIGRGIESSRLEAKGLGENQLTNHCKDGVRCSDALHAQNRRTEIRAKGVQPPAGE